MGVKGFAAEWAERQDRVLKLYGALLDNRRRLCAAVVQAPVLAVNCDANVSSEVVGLDRFRRYYVPYYNEVAEVLHAGGKLAGAHLDARIWTLAEAVEESGWTTWRR